jgi:streptogramin lyase
MRINKALATISISLTVILSGCSAGVGTVESPVTGLRVAGVVYGGQQPVANSKVYMYAAGTGGNRTAAISTLNSPGYVTTDSGGNFSIHDDFTCPSASSLVYTVAVGGNPGLAPGTNNPALVLVDALGPCGDLNAGTNISINEITTAAAAWALAPFVGASYSQMAASPTNTVGLTNAFLDAAMIASPNTGLPPTDLPSNLTIDSGKVYALADALGTCVNSDGTSGCTALFSAATDSGGLAPSDTFQAAIDIVRHPTQNVAAVYNVIPADPAFPTTLTSAPNDWTLTLTITGGGLNAPTSLDIDKSGNVWVANYYGALAEFTPQGTPISPSTGYGAGVLNEAYGLTIDTNGNIWVSNEESSPNHSGSLSEFDGSNTSTPGAVITGNGGTNFYDTTIDYPVALAADTNGDIAIANYANSTATIYSGAGAEVVNVGAGQAAFPVAIAVDSTHGVWIANFGDDTITHESSTGTLLSRPNCCNGANGVATDALGNVWVSDYYGNAFSEVDSTGKVLINDAPIVNASVNTSYPAGIAIDASQNVWIANYRGQSISELAGANSPVPGTVLSGATGLGYQSGNNPLLLLPYALVPDTAGNVWVSNFGNNNLVMFFGLATPTATPTQPVPVAP